MEDEVGALTATKQIPPHDIIELIIKFVLSIGSILVMIGYANDPTSKQLFIYIWALIAILWGINFVITAVNFYDKYIK